MHRLTLLLPPSEGKASGGRRRRSPDRFAEQLATPRAEVRDAVATLLAQGSRELWSKRFKVRGALLDRAVDAMQAVARDEALMMPAWQRYTGVVWDFFDPSTLDAEQRRAVLVPSALYGITTAEDVVADYRLTMNVSLPGVGGLARFWSEWVTDVVAKRARGSQVVNLLPNEHAAAIDFSRVGGVVHVSFKGALGDGAAGHFAKSVKGRFARHLVENGLEQALAFRLDGWSTAEDALGFSLVQER